MTGTTGRAAEPVRRVGPAGGGGLVLRRRWPACSR